VEIELERAQREGRIFNLAIMDLDDFKNINNTYGHQTGDIALKRFTQCLGQSTRNYESAGRLGSDEFLIYFSLDDDRHFIDILKRLMDCANTLTIEFDRENSIHLKTSIGGVYLDRELLLKRILI
jgi:diguanylate cyclase (GGDEF)-like protein